MTQEQCDVERLMQAMGQATPSTPTIPDRATRKLRLKLIAEELRELAEALDCSVWINDSGIMVCCRGDEVNLIEAYDATIDLKVVVIGTDVAMGIDGEPGWAEVHRSNMSKRGAGTDAHGKFGKGPNYSPPNLGPIIELQSSPWSDAPVKCSVCGTEADFLRPVKNGRTLCVQCGKNEIVQNNRIIKAATSEDTAIQIEKGDCSRCGNAGVDVQSIPGGPKICRGCLEWGGSVESALSCPFCGGTKITVEWEPCPPLDKGDTNRRWFAECTQCSCQGPFCQKEPEV